MQWPAMLCKACLLVQSMEGLPDGEAHVQDDDLARLWDELVAGVALQEGAHLVPRVPWLIRLRSNSVPSGASAEPRNCKGVRKPFRVATCMARAGTMLSAEDSPASMSMWSMSTDMLGATMACPPIITSPPPPSLLLPACCCAGACAGACGASCCIMCCAGGCSAACCCCCCCC
jgi:hypothetical protein